MPDVIFTNQAQKLLRERSFCQPHIGRCRSTMTFFMGDTSATLVAGGTAYKYVGQQMTLAGALTKTMFALFSIPVAGTLDLVFRLHEMLSDGTPGAVLATSDAVTAASAVALTTHTATWSSAPTVVRGNFYCVSAEQRGTASLIFCLPHAEPFANVAESNWPAWGSGSGGTGGVGTTWVKSASTGSGFPFWWHEVGGKWGGTQIFFPPCEAGEITLLAGTEYAAVVRPVHDIALSGGRMWFDMDAAQAGNWIFRVYGESTTEPPLAEIQISKDAKGLTAGGTADWFFPSVVRLVRGKKYFVSFWNPNSGTSSTTWSKTKYVPLPAGLETGLKKAIYGHEVWMATRAAATNGPFAAWTEDAAACPFMGLHNAGNYD